jgi:uncharacterized protein (TIGR02246 family)
MSIEDKLVILEIIARYSYAYDAKDADAFAQLFTEDAVWEMLISGVAEPQVYLDSREAIRAWVEQNHRGRLNGVSSRHHQSGTVFDELTSTSARTQTMVLVTHQNATDPAPRPTLSGVYTDHWRKTSNGWRLTRRSLQHDQHTPYHSS